MTSGARRPFHRLLLGIAALLATAASDAPPARTAVRIDVGGGGAGDPVTVVARSASEAITAQAHGAERVVLALAPGDWSVEAEGVAWWAPSVPIAVGSEALAVAVGLVPAGEIRLPVTVPRGDGAPTHAGARLVRLEGGGPGSEVRLRCTVERPDSGPRVRCVAPAGRWEARFDVDRYVPARIAELVVAPAGHLVLPAVALRRGAWISGRVASGDGALDPTVARVLLRRAEIDGANPRSLAASAAVDARGGFQLAGIEPGTYALRAVQGELASPELPLLVQPDQAIELREPLTLVPPARLTVAVEPARAGWRLEIYARRGSALIEKAAGATDDEGRWSSPGLAPGTYTLRVGDEDGNTLRWENDLVLADAETPVRVTLGLVPVRGEVTLGDEPLAAELWLGGRSGSPRRHVTSDGDGRFETTFDRAGATTVDVEGVERPVHVRDLPVEIEKRRDGPARLAIRLPSTRLHGRVIDVEDRPVPGAEVTLARVGVASALWSPSGSDGEFSFDGLAEGGWEVEAAGAGKISESVHVELREDAEPVELELVLRERHRLAGRVSAGAGGVGGADLLVFPATASGTLASASAPQATTGVDGSFSLDLPPATARVTWIAMAPGFALGLGTSSVDGGERPLDVALEPGGGTLELPPLPAAEPGRPGRTRLVVVDGVPVDGHLLAMWSMRNGGAPGDGAPLVVPAMPPGHYLACDLAIDQALAVMGGSAAPAPGSCLEGDLSPGGLLRLR